MVGYKVKHKIIEIRSCAPYLSYWKVVPYIIFAGATSSSDLIDSSNESYTASPTALFPNLTDDIVRIFFSPIIRLHCP